MTPPARAEVWLDDLFWHKKMYRGARWRWWGEHVMKVITGHTGGKLTFDTFADLRLLEDHRRSVADQAFTCQLALADPLDDAGDVLGRWIPVADALGLTEVECSSTVWFADARPDLPRTNVKVEKVLRVVRRQPFNNPLIEAWELKQLWRLHQAAAAMLEDTTCDLIEHLRGSRPDVVLCEAADVVTSAGLTTRVDANRAARGEFGDPRRVPRQVF